MFVTILDDHVERRATSLAAVLENVAGPDVELVWTGNPLRAPLTIDRLILQAAGSAADLRAEHTPGELADMLINAASNSQRLIIVQQPETLDATARGTLAAMALHLAAKMPRVQFLFCGIEAFKPIVTAPASNPTGVAGAQTSSSIVNTITFLRRLHRRLRAGVPYRS